MKLRYAVFGAILLCAVVYKSLDEFDEILIGEKEDYFQITC